MTDEWIFAQIEEVVPSEIAGDLSSVILRRACEPRDLMHGAEIPRCAQDDIRLACEPRDLMHGAEIPRCAQDDIRLACVCWGRRGWAHRPSCGSGVAREHRPGHWLRRAGPTRATRRASQRATPCQQAGRPRV